MKNFTAVIPVRAGSQRVKNKNFKKFADSNLLQIKINQVKKLPVEDIIINTDSELAIEIAKKNNLKYFRRDPYYASSDCSNSEYHEYLGSTTKSKNIIVTQVTSPLVNEKTYLEAIETYFKGDFDSLMSVVSFKEFIIFDNKPFNFTKNKMPNSQDLQEYLIPTFGLVICKREKLIEDKNYLCGQTHYYKISSEESIDIDTEMDFKIAEMLYKDKFNI
ncbi:acylneuraminate cytidylyltransferase family protein [Microbulbifer sp. TRSA005]|uniref:acylneuraminate cytidylyltransferase family protein n=1 Tax=unclassified Microbulbifer TaxID=2619833 RepID=UPI004039FCAB